MGNGVGSGVTGTGNTALEKVAVASFQRAGCCLGLRFQKILPTGEPCAESTPSPPLLFRLWLWPPLRPP